MADEPIIAYNNLLVDGVVVGEGGATFNPALPAANLANWNHSAPAVLNPVDTTASLLIGFPQPVADPSLLIMGAHRHAVGAYRSPLSSVSLSGHAGAGVFTTLINAATLSAENSASSHKFTPMAVVPDTSIFKTRTPLAGTWSRVRWLMGRFIYCGVNATLMTIMVSDGAANNFAYAAITGAPVGTVFDVAADDSGNMIAITSTGASYLSVDGGLTWTLSGTTGVSCASIACDPSTGMFIAFPSAAGTTVYTSIDLGVTWTARTLATSITNKRATFGNGLFMVVGNTGLCNTSPDGITWTAQTTGTANRLTDVIWTGAEWACPTTVGGFINSSDGVTWSAEQATGATALTHLCHNGRYFAAGGVVGGVASVVKSVDGITWTSENAGVYTTIATNGVFETTANTTVRANTSLSVYRLTLAGTTTGVPVTLPEIFLGPRLTMPFVDWGYDPYDERFVGHVFDSESGRQHVTLHYRRIENKPSWSVVPVSYVPAVLDFWETHLEFRKPFWWLWQPDTSPAECYMVRHRTDHAPFKMKNAVQRTFALDLVEAL